MKKEYIIAVYCYKESDSKELEESIKAVMNRNFIFQYNLQVYNQLEDLYKDAKFNGKSYDIYFLDISHNSVDSMKCAEKLRVQGIQESIVYITDNLPVLSNGYKIKILDYLFKPVQYRALEKLILYDYEKHFCQDYVWLKKNSNLFRIRMNTIVCVEVVGRGIKIYVSEETDLQKAAEVSNLREDIDLVEKSIRYTEKLSDFKERLNSRTFIQCHQSFIINLSKTVTIKRYFIIADNGTRCGKRVDISKKYWKDTMQRFTDYIQEEKDKENILTDSELELVAGGKKLPQTGFEKF